MELYPPSTAPAWCLDIRIPFLTLLLSGIGLGNSWAIARGAKVSPFDQNNILYRVRILRWKVWAAKDFARSLVTLPVALWGL